MIIQKRKRYIESIKQDFLELFKNIVSSDILTEPVYISPLSDIPSIEEYVKLQEEQTRKEIDSGFSLFGPHKEDIGFFWKNKMFKEYASLGQMRISGILMKLVQIMYLKNTDKNEPILLLDDIFFELDPFHRDMVKNLLKERFFNMQIFECINDKNQKISSESLVIDLEKKNI